MEFLELSLGATTRPVFRIKELMLEAQTSIKMIMNVLNKGTRIEEFLSKKDRERDKNLLLSDQVIQEPMFCMKPRNAILFKENQK